MIHVSFSLKSTNDGRTTPPQARRGCPACACRARGLEHAPLSPPPLRCLRCILWSSAAPPPPPPLSLVRGWAHGPCTLGGAGGAGGPRPAGRWLGGRHQRSDGGRELGLGLAVVQPLLAWRPRCGRVAGCELGGGLGGGRSAAKLGQAGRMGGNRSWGGLGARLGRTSAGAMPPLASRPTELSVQCETRVFAFCYLTMPAKRTQHAGNRPPPPPSGAPPP